MSRRRSSMNSLDKNPSSRSRSPPRPPPQPGDPVVFEGEDGDEEGDDANSRADMLSMGVDDEHRSHEDMVYETGDQPWIRSVELSPYFQSNEELRGSPVSPDRLVLMSRRRKQPARSRRKSVKSPRSPGHPLLRMMTQRHITSDADGDGEETIPATHPWNRNRDVGRFLSATRPGRRVRGRERRRSSAAGLDASHTDPWDVSF